MSKLEAHEAARLFPMLPEKELRDLADNIKANKQTAPIVLFQGKILDGRNRYAACALVDVEPEFTTLDECESPTAYVLSANLYRRHLSAIDRALLGSSDEVLASFKAEAAERRAEGQKSGGRGNKRNSAENLSAEFARVPDAAERAAKAVGVSRDYVYKMNRIKSEAPEVYERAKAGEFSTVADAARAAGIPVPSSCVRKSEREPDVAPPKAKMGRPPAPANGRPLHERSMRDPELVERVSGLLADGMSISEAAAVIEHGDDAYLTGHVGGFRKPSKTMVSKVQQVRASLSEKADPLESLTEAIEIMESDLKSWCSSFEPKWRTATPAQVDRLRARVDAMVSSARRFVSQLNKEIQS